MKNLGTKFKITEEEYNRIIYDCVGKSKLQTMKYMKKLLKIDTKDADELYNIMLLKGDLL